MGENDKENYSCIYAQESLYDKIQLSFEKHGLHFALIAKKSGCPVQLICIDCSAAYLGKKWPLYRPPPFPLRVRVRLRREASGRPRGPWCEGSARARGPAWARVRSVACASGRSDPGPAPSSRSFGQPSGPSPAPRQRSCPMPSGGPSSGRSMCRDLARRRG